MGLCYYALGWRKVPRLETTTVTYYHTEYTMNKGFDNIIVVKDMKEAVNASYQIAKDGDVVLLSPACASWDMYKSFEVRGIDFKDNVNNLK